VASDFVLVQFKLIDYLHLLRHRCQNGSGEDNEGENCAALVEL
jgi:hypothetical protein